MYREKELMNRWFFYLKCVGRVNRYIQIAVAVIGVLVVAAVGYRTKFAVNHNT